MHDLLLKGGSVIDGTGARRVRADVLIQGERIAAVGDLGAAHARQTLDVSGKIVAPGFVDVHNHSDGWLLKHPHFLPKISQGFTTEVLMADGISYAPLTPELAPHWMLYLRPLNGLRLSEYTGWRSLADYLALLDRRTAQNVIAHVPYANVRALCAGWGRRIPDDTQIKLMQREVRRGMEAGAVGVSTGLDYIAQAFASTAEIAEVCAAMAPWRGLYVTHIRYKKGLLPALREAVEIGRRAGVPVHISHLKANSPQEAETVLTYIEREASHEVDFSFDVYPYMPSSTLLHYLLPYEVWEDGPLHAAAKLADPVLRARFAELLQDFGLGLDRIFLAWAASKANAQFQGRSLAEYVNAVQKPAADALCDLLIEEQLAVLLVYRWGDDRLVDAFLSHPKCMLGSDGIFAEDGAVHPRVYGSAARMLGPLVRERRLFSLEEAVRKLSGFPAERFGLKGRGVIREGAFADVVVFEAETVADRATFEAPRQLSAGIEEVFVNGVAIWQAGRPLEGVERPLPGRRLTFNA